MSTQAVSGPEVIRPEAAEKVESVKIALLGPPQSGKTTYLGALYIATLSPDSQNGSWRIRPCNEASREFRDRLKTALKKGEFPDATSGNTTIEWLFVGDLSKSIYDHRRIKIGKLKRRFQLDLIDVPGNAYMRDQNAGQAEIEDASAAMDHLYEAQGIIYMFDPIGDRDNQNAADYLSEVLSKLELRAAQSGRANDLYLKYQVSVCITKFDHPRLFNQVQRASFVDSGQNYSDGMPRIREKDARQFLAELCHGNFWEGRIRERQPTYEQVVRQLERAFDPSRIRYFVTSSIGFYKTPPVGDETNDEVDLREFNNYHERGGKARIRGEVRPINVIEPLISLQQRIAKG